MVELPHRLDAVFHALADPTRRAMLHELAEGERTIGQLAGPHRMSFAGASKHVRVLERAGLVRRTIRGRAHVCSLAPEPLADVHDWLRFYRRFFNQRPGGYEPAPPEPRPDAELRGARGEEADG